MEDLSNTHDGYTCVLFMMNPENNHWSIGLGSEMMDPKRFSIISAGAGKILENMLKGVEKCGLGQA